MLKFFKGFICGALVSTIGLGIFLANYHVIRTEERFAAVPRVEWGAGDIYVDLRGWGLLDYSHHPKLTRALGKAGIAQAQDKAQDLYDQALKSIDQQGQKLKSLFE